MCPTELFYDTDAGSYLRLLPIDTRKEDISLAEYKLIDEHWHYFPLDIQSPESMRASLDQVASVLSVRFDEARSLGFEVSGLEKDPDNPRLCLVPAWRHALISLKNPILQQGLRILDTPGLNALGSEPELTISMIPSAHAVIFLLGADTGVTASDMEIWDQYIHTDGADHRAGRFAVMNKIDMLWDDIQGEHHTNRAIDAVRQKTASQLNLKPEEVLLTSAKQALMAKVRGDQSLLDKSQIARLEQLLSHQILTQKERILTHTLVNDVLGMLHTSQMVLESRRQGLRAKLDESKQKGVSKDFIKSLTRKTQDDYNYYYKQLFTLRSSRRLMKSQAMILSKLVNSDKFENSASKTRKDLVNSWTTMGMARAMSQFFEMIENDLNNLNHEAYLAQKMVKSIFERYANDPKSRHLKPVRFNINRQLNELKSLKSRTEKFKRNLSTVMTEQTIVVKRFFTTLVSEARKLYQEIEKESQRWPQEALLPILQHTTEQKQLLEQQIKRLKELANSAKDTRSQIDSMHSFLRDIDIQIQEAELLQRKLKRPAPLKFSDEIANFS